MNIVFTAKKKPLLLVDDVVKKTKIRDMMNSLNISDIVWSSNNVVHLISQILINVEGVYDTLISLYEQNVDILIWNEVVKLKSFIYEHNIPHLISSDKDVPRRRAKQILVLSNISEELASYIRDASDVLLSMNMDKFEFLEDNSHGTIYTNKNKFSASEIYINGVKVYTDIDYYFSYNITKVTQTLNNIINIQGTVNKTHFSKKLSTLLCNCTSNGLWDKLESLYYKENKKGEFSLKSTRDKVEERIITKNRKLEDELTIPTISLPHNRRKINNERVVQTTQKQAYVSKPLVPLKLSNSRSTTTRLSIEEKEVYAAGCNFFTKLHDHGYLNYIVEIQITKLNSIIKTSINNSATDNTLYINNLYLENKSKFFTEICSVLPKLKDETGDKLLSSMCQIISLM